MFEVDRPLARLAGARCPDDCLVDFLIFGVDESVELTDKFVVVAAEPDAGLFKIVI